VWDPSQSADHDQPVEAVPLGTTMIDLAASGCVEAARTAPAWLDAADRPGTTASFDALSAVEGEVGPMPEWLRWWAQDEAL